MARARFIRGAKDKFLNYCGIPYGNLEVHGSPPSDDIFAMRQGKEISGLWTEQGLIEPDEAVLLDQQMEQTGLLPDIDQVFEKIVATEPPPGFEPQFRFRVCAGGLPVPHGHICRGDTPISERIFATRLVVMIFILETVNRDLLVPAEGVCLFRSASEAGLLRDTDQVREKLQVQGGGLSVSSHQGDTVWVISISGPGMELLVGLSDSALSEDPDGPPDGGYRH